MNGDATSAVDRGDRHDTARRTHTSDGHAYLASRNGLVSSSEVSCVPAVLGEVDDRRDVLDAGVGHDHVDAPVRLERGVDRPPVALARRQVRLHRHGAVRTDVDAHHVHALGGQSLGHGTADAACRSCDDRCTFPSSSGI